MKPDPTNKQQIFDFIVRKLAAQGKPSMTPSGGCAYRDSNGCRCAVGFLIRDDEYSSRWDYGKGVPIRSANGPRQLLMAKGHDLSFLANLQNAHDSAAPITMESYGNDPASFLNTWKAEFAAVAKKHGLKGDMVSLFERKSA